MVNFIILDEVPLKDEDNRESCIWTRAKVGIFREYPNLKFLHDLPPVVGELV